MTFDRRWIWLLGMLILWGIPAGLLWAGVGTFWQWRTRQTVQATWSELERRLDTWVERAQTAVGSYLNAEYDRLQGRSLTPDAVATALRRLLAPFPDRAIQVWLLDGAGRRLDQPDAPEDDPRRRVFQFIKNPWTDGFPFTAEFFQRFTEVGPSLDFFWHVRGFEGQLRQPRMGKQCLYRWTPTAGPGQVGGMVAVIDQERIPVGWCWQSSRPTLADTPFVAGGIAEDGVRMLPPKISEHDFAELLRQARAAPTDRLLVGGWQYALRSVGAGTLLLMGAPLPHPPRGLLLALFVGYAFASFRLLVGSHRLVVGGRRLVLPLRRKLALLFLAAGVFPLTAAAALAHATLAAIRDDLRTAHRQAAYARLGNLEAGFERFAAEREREFRHWSRELGAGRLPVASLARLLEEGQATARLSDALLIASTSQVVFSTQPVDKPEVAWLLAQPLAERQRLVSLMVRQRLSFPSPVVFHRVMELPPPPGALGKNKALEARDRAFQILSKVARQYIAFADRRRGLETTAPPAAADLVVEEMQSEDGQTVFQMTKLFLGQLLGLESAEANGDFFFADVPADRHGKGQYLLFLILHPLNFLQPYLEASLAGELGGPMKTGLRAICVSSYFDLGPSYPLEEGDPFPALARHMVGHNLRTMETTLEWQGEQIDAVLLKSHLMAGYVFVHCTPHRELARQLAPYRWQAGLALAGVAGLSLSLGWLVLSAFLVPVQELAAGVAALRRNDLQHRVRVETNDELGQICELLNRTLAHLQEMELGFAIQGTLYPAAPLRIGPYEILGKNRMTQAIGGDYFDYFPLPNGKVAIIVADVTGHGLSAALVTAMAKAAFTILAVRRPDDPAEIMTACNTLLFELLQRQKMLTAQLLVLDPAAGALTIANAGHLFPLIFQADGSLLPLSLSSYPLGTKKAGRCALATIEQWTEPVVLITDGLVEALCPDGTQVNFPRLHEAVRRGLHQSSAAPADAIFENIRQLTDPVPWADDATLVILRRAG